MAPLLPIDQNASPSEPAPQRRRKPSVREVAREGMYMRYLRMERDIESLKADLESERHKLDGLKNDEAHSLTLAEKRHDMELEIQENVVVLEEQQLRISTLTRDEQQLHTQLEVCEDHYEKLKAERSEILRFTVDEAELQDLANRVDGLSSVIDEENRAGKKRYADYAKDLQDARDELDAKEQLARKLRLLIAEESLKTHHLDGNLAEAEKRLNCARADEARAVQELNDVTAQQHETCGELDELEAQLQRIHEECREASDQITEVNREISKLKQQVQGEKQQHEDELAAIRRKHDCDMASVRSSMETHPGTAQLEKVSREQDELCRQIDSTKNELQQLRLEAVKHEQLAAESKRATAKMLAEREHEVELLDKEFTKLRTTTQQTISRLKSERSELAVRRRKALEDIATMRRVQDMMAPDMAALQTQLSACTEERNSQQVLLAQKEQEYTDAHEAYTQQCHELEAQLHVAQRECDKKSAELAAAKQATSDATERYNAERNEAAIESQRLCELQQELESWRQATRRFQNRIQELKGTIRVIGRVRRALTPDIISMRLTSSAITLQNASINARGQGSTESVTVGFDRVFGMQSTNRDICEEADYIVQSALDGKMASILAYGQTGSGKTHTMSGPGGVIHHALEQIFAFAETQHTCRVFIEAVEIYNETIRDMLAPKQQQPLRSTTSIRAMAAQTIDLGPSLTKTPNGAPELRGVTRQPVTTLDEALEVLQNATNNRAVAATAANTHSSRSHSIFSVHIESSSRYGVLNLIDLAGSERVQQSQVVGARLKETGAINSSLSMLGNVINALQTKKVYVPYRNSKLTFFLEGALRADAKMMIITTFSPEKSSLEETKSTLRFAERVGKVLLK